MSDSNQRLIYMANLIAKNVSAEGEEKAVSATAEHIKKVRDPRMRAMILEHLKQGGDGLDAIPRRALERLAG